MGKPMQFLDAPAQQRHRAGNVVDRLKIREICQGIPNFLVPSPGLRYRVKIEILNAVLGNLHHRPKQRLVKAATKIRNREISKLFPYKSRSCEQRREHLALGANVEKSGRAR